MRVFVPWLLVAFVWAGCSSGNITENTSLQGLFDSAHVNGCFALFDNGRNDFVILNLKRYRDSAFSPASTFKIVNSLIGLQTGAITGPDMVIKWDGVKRWMPDWNQDLTMRQAFAVSSVPYYQEVARRIGRPAMKKWIDTLGYGNKDISGPIDSFWLNGRLRITPDEELGLVKKLYFDQLPFFHSVQDTVKTVMLRESNTNYRLSYKTGWGKTPAGHELGWVTGWIEENRHPYFFVLNIDSPDPKADIVTVRMNLLKAILARMGFLQGKK